MGENLRMITAEKEHSMQSKDQTNFLDGKTIDYTYEGGWRFRVRFGDGRVGYEFLGETEGEVSNANENIPYQARQIREGLYHVVWHETDIGDLVSLVIDIENERIYSAALLGYREADVALHFEPGILHSVQ